MKRLGVFFITLVFAFVNLNVFAVEPEIEYNTSISGDINLNFNDEWSPGFIFKSMRTNKYLAPDKDYIEIFAAVNVKGNTDAESLSFIYPNGINDMVDIKLN